MKRLHEFLLYLMVILTPFQDTFLREPLRQLGASFAVLPLLALVAIDCVNWLASEERRVNLKWVAIGLYALLLNALALTLSGTEWNGVNLLLKVPNVFFLTALALYVVFRPKWIELDHLGAAVKIAFGIAVVGVLLGDLNLLGLRGVVDNPILHRTINPDTRWRGLTSEASTLSLSLGSLGLLSAALSRGIARALFLTATVFLLCAGASKGAIPAMLAVGIGLIVFSTGNRFWAAAITILLLPVGYFGYQRVQILSATDALSQTTTAATRATVVVWAIDVIARNPLGVGFSGFYPALSRQLPDAIDTVSKISPVPLNFEEVLGYVTSGDNASSKTLLFNYGAYFGIPFLIVFAVFIVRLMRACVRGHQPLLLATLLYVTVAISTYNDPITYYSTFVIYGVGWQFYRSVTPPARSLGLPLPAGSRG
jgi:hypothetical protein